MTGEIVSRRDRLLLAFLYVAMAAMLAHAHAVRIDQPNRAQKLARHESVLRNQERDPYQYKLWAVTWVVEGVHEATGARVFHVYLASVFLSLLALLVTHHLWLAKLYSGYEALLGTCLLGLLCHGLFYGYQHHPYDFWGVAGFCLLLHQVASGAPWLRLCIIGLLVGFVWEKHALVALVWGAMAWRAGSKLLPTALRAAVFALSCVAIPVAIRLGLGTNREIVDVTPFSEQDWPRIFAHHAPYVLPFFAMLVFARARIPVLVRWLWIYVPFLFGAYLYSRYMLFELRSFWAFAPVFTATACGWARGLRSSGGDAGGSGYEGRTPA